MILYIILPSEIAKPKKYAWEQPHYNEDDDPFLQHFDENGNFIEKLPEESEEIVEEKPRIKITYHIRRRKND